MSKKQSEAIQQPLDIVPEPTRVVNLRLPESLYTVLSSIAKEEYSTRVGVLRKFIASEAKKRKFVLEKKVRK